MLLLSPPKAEVTGSNPVGCANVFNWLWSGCGGSGLEYVRIILVVGGYCGCDF